MFYHAKTNGFYDPKIGTVPDDAIEISDEKYKELMDGAATGLMISSDDRGNPILKQQDEPSDAEKAERRNRRARNYLAETDWYVVRKMETGAEIPQEILDARSAARLSVTE